MSLDLRTPVDEYLARQRDATAVERFAEHHDRTVGPLHARWYEALLPASPPAPGQQYRFEVDMDACTSCKSCVTACHSLNGLDEGEAWRSVGVLTGIGPTGPTQQTVTTSCHHCVDPGCLAGCPVDAYDKDPATGIVRHLDDQCIGCTYCVWTCPYDVPRFNERLGIVRKCDMCADRLAAGEAPACVQACPNGAIAIGIVEVDALRAASRSDDVLVPGAPPSAVTVPSTAYRRRVDLPADAVATDAWSERPRHTHVPLVVMLVLTQVAVGAFAAIGTLARTGELDVATERWSITAAMLTGLVALGASVGHLGRPLQAWRAVIGVRHSWLSREIVAFGAFAGLAVLASVLSWATPGHGVGAAAGAAATGVGFVAVGCSVMVYAATGRRWWRFDRTLRAFAATTVIGGSSVAATVALMATAASPSTVSHLRPLFLATAIASVVALVADAVVLGRGQAADEHLARSVALMRGPLARTSAARFGAGLLGGVVVPLLLISIAGDPVAGLGDMRVLAVCGTAAVLVGELAGRRLFFAAMVSARMPGVPR